MEKESIRDILFRLELKRKMLLRPHFLELGLTTGQGQPRILKSLFDHGPMTQKELSYKCLRDTATMSRTLDRLQQAGLILRKPHPECRRSYLISLTEEGKKKAGEVAVIFRQADERIWEGISPQEMEQLFLTLEKIERNLNSELEKEEKV